MFLHQGWEVAFSQGIELFPRLDFAKTGQGKVDARCCDLEETVTQYGSQEMVGPTARMMNTQAHCEAPSPISSITRKFNR